MINPRTEDGSVSGSYITLNSSGNKVNFSVTADGFATFSLEGAPEFETLMVNLISEQSASLAWKGTILDGLGALTGDEQAALDELMQGDLAHSLGMIPLDIGCLEDENIDAKQVAALLVPLQMRFKYLVTERSAESQELIALSQCNYGGSDENKGEQPSIVTVSRAAPVPVVLGYSPFDREGAMEALMSSVMGLETACLVDPSSITADGLISYHLSGSPPETMIGVHTDEFGPCNALCRGACGSDCISTNCKQSKSEHCELDHTGRYTGIFAHYLVYECGLHQGCIDHDYCYDQCNSDYGCGTWDAYMCRHGSVSKDNPPTSPPPAWWHCDQKAVAEHGHKNTSDWSLGYGPHSTTEKFEYSVKSEQNLKECPEGEKPPAPPASEDASIPVGTYIGTSNFPSKRADAADFDSDVIIKEDTIRLVVEEDGTAHGELISNSYTTYKEQSYHSVVNGVISGQLTEPKGQLSISYSWRSYNDGPQCTPDTPCIDDTVNFVFPYHVNVTGNLMKFTPAADVEDFYDFELTKQ